MPLGCAAAGCGKPGSTLSGAKKPSARPPPAGGARQLHEHAVSDQADSQALNFEGLSRCDHNGRIVGILGVQLNLGVMAVKAFDGDVVPQAGHNDLAVAGLTGGLHGQKIAVHDASIAHGHAAHAQEVIGLLGEKARLEVVGLVDVLLGQDRRAGCDAAYEG